MITIKQLKWDNCFSYGEGNCLDLTENRLTQLIGLNGAGKSSIPLILEEALFNKNSKGIKKSEIPNRAIKKPYNIEVYFTKNDDDYIVKVQRSTNVKVSIHCNGVDLSSHTATQTYKTIQEILGVDFKTFSQLVYQSPISGLQFLTATDTNRKKFLIDLLSLDNYVKLFTIFKDAHKTLNDELQRLEGQCDSIKKWLETNKLKDTQVLPLLNFPKKPEEDEEQLRSLLLEIKNISQKNRKILQNNEYRQQLSSIDIAALKSSEYKKEKDTQDLQKEIGAFTAEIKRHTTSLNRMESLKDICMTCEQPINPEFKKSLIEEERTNLKKAKESKEAHEQLLKEYQVYNKEVRKVKAEINRWEELYRNIDNSLPTELLNEDELNKKATAIQKVLTNYQSQYTKTETENQKRTAHNARIDVIVEQTRDLQSQLDTIFPEIDSYKKSVANLEILKKAFSTNGLVAYKIENLVKELEIMTNEYLAELSDGRFTIEFKVTNDKLNVLITDNGQEIEILSLSSGELGKVNTATLIAIRKLMSSISKTKINVLFLDEVINVSDELSREKIVEILLEEDLNTFLVSHHWQHPLLSKLHIYKENNISRLET